MVELIMTVKFIDATPTMFFSHIIQYTTIKDMIEQLKEILLRVCNRMKGMSKYNKFDLSFEGNISATNIKILNAFINKNLKE